MNFNLKLTFLALFMLSLSSAQPVFSQLAGTTTTQSTPPFTDTPGSVEFNHHDLFQLQPNPDGSGQDRADLANIRLQSAWSANYSHNVEADPTSVIIATQYGPLIIVNGQKIVYVSSADSATAGVNDEQLAETWKNLIDRAFRKEIIEKRPEYVKTEIRQSTIDIGLGLAVFVIVLYLRIRLKARRPWSVYLAIAFYVAHQVISIYPNVRTISFDIWTGPFRPLLIIIYVAVPAAAIARIWGVVLHSLIPPLPEHISSQDLIRRTNLRRRTLAGVAEVTGVSLVWLFAVATAMSWYGFNPSSLLTSAGLIGVAIGLVAQDSIRDTLAGVYIFIDDRYGVGDIIKIGDYEGRVERFNLRMTQIRDSSGRLITLSNRNTTEVANLTARWAQVDFRIGVSYYDSLDHALSVLETTAKTLATEWPERIIADPEIIGVESFNDINITIRLIARTPPGDQSIVAHELRKRVKAAFDNEGISIINEQHKTSIT